MNANDLFNDVMQLDLEPIKTKLMHDASGEGWSRDKADAVEKEYRRFLCLMKLYPDEDTAPLVDVDTFWHYHILDTMKYAADCERVFGYFLHHYPYVGMRGGDDEQFRVDSGNRMRELYEATFGEPYPGATAGRSEAAYCAGPHAQAAYCAGPHAEAAYCAGPHAQAAYCAGPHAQTAYCAGPHAQTAYCAGPHDAAHVQRTDGAAGAAWCAGPHAAARARGETGAAGATRAAAVSAPPAATADATSWCAGPHGAARAAATATAWCAGPHASRSAS